MAHDTARRDSPGGDASGSPARTTPSRRGRRIAFWGTTSRAVAGAAAVTWALAVPHARPWLDLPGAGSRLWGTVFGLLVLPAILTLVVVLRGRSAPDLRLGAPAAVIVTTLVIVVAQAFPVAILMGIGSTLLLLAARGDDGCEILAVPNLVLRRRDHLACLPFTPIDEWERGRPAGTST